MRRHIPVLANEVFQALPKQLEVFMDGTMGHGGHSQRILERRKSETLEIVGVDRDEHMLEKAKHFLDEFKNQVTYVQGSYANFQYITTQSGHDLFDGILIDIGVNMDHFKEADRGFSIKKDGPLDMRYDRSAGVSAEEWLYRTTYDQLCEVLEKYTDFGTKFREWVAKEMTLQKKTKPFATTQEIRERAKKLNINDKMLAILFQAIRIEVNGELDELADFLKIFRKHLQRGGRCIVLSYHSIEDRMIKIAFKDLAQQGKGMLVNKKVITPTWQETQKNKAARSAKMRVFERT